MPCISDYSNVLFLHDACIYRLAITAQRCSWLTILKRCITKKQTSNVSKYFHKQSSLLQGSLNKQNKSQRMQLFNKIKPSDLAHILPLRQTSPLFPKPSEQCEIRSFQCTRCSHNAPESPPHTSYQWTGANVEEAAHASRQIWPLFSRDTLGFLLTTATSL